MSHFEGRGRGAPPRRSFSSSYLGPRRGIVAMIVIHIIVITIIIIMMIIINMYIYIYIYIYYVYNCVL